MQNNYPGYTVYTIDEPSFHDLFTLELTNRPFMRGNPPPFYLELLGTVEPIVSQYHEYHEERQLIYREYSEVLGDLSWSNYNESLTLKLVLWAADLRRHLRSLGTATCVILPRDRDRNEFAFQISGCDVHLSMNDKLIAINHVDKKVFVGLVMAVTLTEVVARMPRQFELARKRKFEISFEINWLPFIIQKHCLDHATEPVGVGAGVLFPTRAVRRPPMVEIPANSPPVWHDTRMNENQKEVVLTVLKGEYRPVPYLVSGPPGTGKTSTLIEYVHQIYKRHPQSKILICATSNTAANVVLKMLRRSRWINVKSEIIRMLSYSYSVSGDLPRNLQQFCGVLPMETHPEGVTLIQSLEQLQQYRVVISTINYSANFLRMGMRSHFSHLIVDEAGQALETETLIPFALMPKETSHLALFGDEKQLGPVVLYTVLQQMGFDKSMFERLSSRQIYFDHETILYSRLINNYRSVPTLLRYYNNLFYDERLIPMVTDGRDPEFQLLNRLDDLFPPNPRRTRYQGMYFFNVMGDCLKEMMTQSWYNIMEVHQMLEFYRKLLAKRVRPADIGMVTPYRAQTREILNALNAANLPLPKVGTVEVFQGDERMIILMSPVRSYFPGLRAMANVSLGFVNNPKRINVAISRARALVVIFGNKTVLSASNHWSRLITMVEENRTLIL